MLELVLCHYFYNKINEYSPYKNLIIFINMHLWAWYALNSSYSKTIAVLTRLELFKSIDWN